MLTFFFASSFTTALQRVYLRAWRRTPGGRVGAYARAMVWLPVVTSNETQFGFFGVALALVTWLTGAAVCILVGACAGPVLAEDKEPVEP